MHCLLWCAFGLCGIKCHLRQLVANRWTSRTWTGTQFGTTVLMWRLVHHKNKRAAFNSQKDTIWDTAMILFVDSNLLCSIKQSVESGHEKQLLWGSVKVLLMCVWERKTERCGGARGSWFINWRVGLWSFGITSSLCDATSWAAPQFMLVIHAMEALFPLPTPSMGC